MVKELKDRIILRPYFWMGILLFLFLIGFSYRKGMLVEKEANERIKMMVDNVAKDNINTMRKIVMCYVDQLEYIKYTMLSSESNLSETIRYFSQKDSILRKVKIVEINPRFATYQIHPIINDSTQCLEFMLPLGSKNTLQNKALSLKVNLMDLHKKISRDKNVSPAYVTLSQNNTYIFHPDETKIGKPVKKDFLCTEDFYREKIIKETYSEYLQIPVYRYYDMAELGGQQWLFTASIPGLSFKDFVSKTQNAFIYTALLALLAFVVIFFFGILHWQKEFLQRQHIQQEKIELELKNEQQKQQVLATELEQLKSGLNPHFLFNSLGSLKALVNKQPAEAKRFAVALSNLYRYLLKQENCTLISLQEEFDFAKDYIYLQQIRFSERIEVEISIPKEDLKRQLPPMSLQLLIENCIKHTKMSSSEKLFIKIQSKGNQLVVTNNYNPIEQITTSGIGLDNLTKRYSYLTSAPCSFYIRNEQFVAEIPLI